jgi:hypothetical protein
MPPRREILTTGLTAAACTLVGGMLLAWVLPGIVAGFATFGWPQTKGNLLEASLEHEIDWRYDEGVGAHWLELRYVYAVADADGGESHYTGRRWDVGTERVDRPHLYTPFARRVMAREVIAGAPDVAVYYDPEAPDQSVVIRGVPVGTLGLLLPCIGYLSAAFMLWRQLLPWWRGCRGQALAPLAGAGAGAQGVSRSGIEAALAIGLVWPLLYCLGGVGYYGLVYTAVGEACHLLVPNWVGLSYPVLGILVTVFPQRLKALDIWPLRVVVPVAVVAVPILIGVALVRGICFNAADPCYQPTDAQLLEQLRSPRGAHRQWATYELVRQRRRPAGIVAALIESVAHADPGVRRTAIHGLRHQGVPARAAIPALLQAVHDPAAKVSSLAAETLMELAVDPASYLEAALALLEGSADHQRQGLRLLRRLGARAEPARLRLLDLLAGGSSTLPRAALSVLGRLHNPPREVIPAAIAMLRDPSGTSRFVALTFLADAVRPLGADGAAAVDRLIGLLDSSSATERHLAARALGAIGGPAVRAMPRLRHMAVGGRQASQKADARVARAALEQLGAAPVR